MLNSLVLQNSLVWSYNGPDEELCPVWHMHHYLTLSKALTQSDTLCCYDSATWHHSLCYLAAVLQGAGVDAALGSYRASVASTLLAIGFSDNVIIASVDWASACMLYQHYLCVFWRQSKGRKGAGGGRGERELSVQEI